MFWALNSQHSIINRCYQHPLKIISWLKHILIYFYISSWNYYNHRCSFLLQKFQFFLLSSSQNCFHVQLEKITETKMISVSFCSGKRKKKNFFSLLIFFLAHLYFFVLIMIFLLVYSRKWEITVWKFNLSCLLLCPLRWIGTDVGVGFYNFGASHDIWLFFLGSGIS